MKTLKLDAQRRLRLSQFKPGQVFALEPGADGSVTLTPVKAEHTEMFPPGSLLKYFTGELGRKRDQEETAIASGCLQGPP